MRPTYCNGVRRSRRKAWIRSIRNSGAVTYLHSTDAASAIGAHRLLRRSSRNHSSAGAIITMSLWPSAIDCETPSGTHPNSAMARQRSRAGLSRWMASIRNSDQSHAAAIRTLNSSPIAIALFHASNATSADSTPHSGP